MKNIKLKIKDFFKYTLITYLIYGLIVAYGILMLNHDPYYSTNNFSQQQ